MCDRTAGESVSSAAEPEMNKAGSERSEVKKWPAFQHRFYGSLKKKQGLLNTSSETAFVNDGWQRVGTLQRP